MSTQVRNIFALSGRQTSNHLYETVHSSCVVLTRLGVSELKLDGRFFAFRLTDQHQTKKVIKKHSTAGFFPSARFSPSIFGYLVILFLIKGKFKIIISRGESFSWAFIEREREMRVGKTGVFGNFDCATALFVALISVANFGFSI